MFLSSLQAKKMRNKQINIIIFLIAFCFSCKIQKVLPTECKMPNEDLSQVEYGKAIEDWEECLVNRRINEKTKKELYNEIRGKIIHTGILEGIEGKVSDKYLSAKALRRILTDKELNQNLLAKDPSIKYNSFLAIEERKNQDVYKTLINIISDTTKIETQFDSIVEEITFADLCINTVTEIYLNNYGEYRPSQYQLTKEEKKELDKLVLNSNLNLEYRKYIEKE